ncbi:MAG: DUF928 domain-containing protein [Leptolyngbyaceae cyanobacterium bins.302]|nr:DUF928 domain-containing protein [Leptolyngbyaceae cyanobacterium bins.302]
MIHRRLPPTLLKLTTLASTALCLTLLASSAALAGYNPRNPSRPVVKTGSTATRSICKPGIVANSASPSSLTVLAPRDHIGRTASTHPTLVWYVSEQESYPVEVSLFEYGTTGRGKLIRTFKLESSSGIMQWTLPQDQPGLTPGKTYLWQVALICNPLRPSQSQWVEAIVQATETPSSLQAALQKTTDLLARADAYAEAGFWYDALAETFKSPNAKSLRLSFLQQLSQLESPSQRSQLEAIMQSDRL